MTLVARSLVRSPRALACCVVVLVSCSNADDRVGVSAGALGEGDGAVDGAVDGAAPDASSIDSGSVDSGPDSGPAEPDWFCEPELNLIVGTSGPDTLTGTAGDDCIVGLGGDDVLDGLGGNDRVWGGSGNDVLFGGDGDDHLEGQTGDDELHGGAGADTLVGHEGDDAIFGDAGDDYLKGKEGCDRLVDTAGADNFFGDEGDDVILAGNGFWFIDGGADDDVIHVEGTYTAWWASGGTGTDHCDADQCEAPETAVCATNADCAVGQRCETPPGVCVPDGFCGGGGCAASDPTCDGVDDDCDAVFDEDYASEPTSCGLGACAAAGSTSCSGGAVVDSCAPGTPAADDSTCDAIDDDCDGLVDESYPGATTSCGVGACAASGALTCVAGSEQDDCSPGAGTGNDATCDGIDDDCDGLTDEAFASSSTSCGVGACEASGATSCSAGVVQDSCAPGTPVADDACDGVDQDCDGVTDEGYVPVATTCGEGACGASGTTSCVGGSVVDSCAPGSPSPDTSCDGLDQDCDSLVDEGYVSVATSCGTGACGASGATSCVGGSVADSCTPGAPSADDVCDGVDQDCDGSVDEAYAPVSTSCGVGACGAAGSTACVGGAIADSCSPGAPTADDVCDGVDQDCDGAVDEAYVPSPTSCGVGACAAAGSLTCVSGTEVDTCAAGAPAADDATCDAVDDDCDAITDEDFAPYCAGDDVMTCAGGMAAASPCGDADACNGVESCAGGVCTPGTPPTLDDGNPCTADSCDASTGVSHDPEPSGTDCDDGDVCDGVATCDGAGVCAPGTPPALDDGNACTQDLCDPTTGPAHPPEPAGTDCDDGDPCNGLETCDGAGACMAGPRPVTGPCVPPGPVAGIFVDEHRDVSNATVGGTVVSYDGTWAPRNDASGLTYTPSPETDGAADIVLDLAGDAPVVLGELRYRPSSSSDARFVEIHASESGLAEADFQVIWAGELPQDATTERIELPASSARFVRVRILEDWSGRLGEGYVSSLGFWTRERSGGSLSLHEAGVPVVASVGAAPQAATDFSTATYWDTYPSGAPIFGQTLTVDLPGSGWHVVDRIRLWAGGGAPNLRNFEVLTSASGDADADFSLVKADMLPGIGASTGRYYWFFFEPTPARYVRLRTIDSHRGDTVTVNGFGVFTPHDGGLTVPFTDTTVAGGTPLVRHTWDFGDGTRSHDRHPIHTFPGPGTYVVTLEVVDGYGLTDLATFAYTANPGPVADFVHSPSEPLQADSLRLDDRSGGPAPIVGVEATTTGEPLSSSYDGRTQPVLAGGSATYAMERSGTVRVRWRAFDATLISHAIERDIPVGNATPEIDVGDDQTLVWGQPWAPLDPATLTDLTTEWASLSCAYDFGDGVSAPGPSPCTPTAFYVTHQWADPGTYTVTATVTDPVGGTADDVFFVEVTPRETSLTLSPVPGAESGGSRTVAAQLADRFDPATPVAGRTVRFQLGAQSVSGVTDATGRASVTLDFAAGAADQRVVATFDGDTHYVASRNEASFPETLRPSYPGNCGTDYVIAFPNPCFDDGSCPAGGRDGEPFYRHSLYFSSESNTNVTVEMPGVGSTAQVAVEAGSVAQYELPLDVAVQLTASRVNHTLRIRSERIVCVHGLEFNQQGTDGFLALPTNSLGSDYVVASHGGIVRNGYFGPYLTSQLAVVGTAAGTTVTITPSDELAAGPVTPGTVFEPAGVPFTVTLDEGEVVQLRAYSGNTPAAGDPNRWDLTGTTISASAPVAVFAGHQCPYVPEGVEACNTLVEQLPSTETLGTQYLLTPFPTRGSGYIARVVAAHDGTEVRHDGALVATLARGAFHDIDVATAAASEVETTQPALVVQFAKGLDAETAPTADRGDPTMLVAVPVEQFDNGALVSTITDSERWSFDHYLNLLAPTAEVGGVLVDGAAVSAAWTTIGASGWSYAMELVSAGAHRVSHPNPTVAIGVTLSGSAEYDAYAFPARMRLTQLAGGCTPSSTSPGDGIDNDCDGRLDEELANGLDDDGDGLTDEDLFFETGAAVNLPPFAHDRSDALREDTSKTLVLSGFDPNGDAITYEILSLPSSGTLSGSANAYLYNPSGDFFGVDSFTYRVCDASECSGAATFTILVRPENDAPVITMDATYNAIENQLFELPLVGADLDASLPVTWTLVSGPSGLDVDSALSLLYWTPDDRYSNTVSPVTIRATDDAGASTDFTFGIEVLSRPDAPYIVSRPVRGAAYGVTYVYDVEAIDPDPFDVVDFQLLEGPPGLMMDTATGLITWAPSLSDVGSHDVEVIARDDLGLFSEPQRFAIEVTGDVTPPVVSLTAYPEPLIAGQATTLTVTATDNDDVSVTGATVDGAPVTLAPDGTGTWTPSAPGRFTATAEAVDPSGNTGTATLEIRVLDTTDTAAPFVELAAPSADSVLTYLHDATGTVRDDNLLRWWLEMRPADRGSYRTLLTGTNAIEAGSLGQLDTTQLRNGTYFLRLRAEDINGQVAQDEHPVRVEGGAKIGVVRLEFTDIVMPDFGIPLAVNRVYDSRLVPDQGDFGVGWQLDIRQGSIQHNYPLGEGVALYTAEGDWIPCQRFEDQLGHYAEVRLSDDEWYLFRPIVPDPGAISGGCGGHVNYEQVDGTRPDAVLTPIGENLVRASAISVVVAGGWAQESNLRSVVDDQLYDPEDFRLRLADGRVFDINVHRGITRVEDRNGNFLQINEEGLVHSSGGGMVFVRDAEDRITQVIDGAGRSTGYEYDAEGNLVAFLDVAGRRTTYEYTEPAFPHHLTDIVDWRGVRMAAMDYQSDGRLRELCDADGVCLESQYDLAARSMTRFDGLRRPTRYSYDEQGNVVGVLDGAGNFTEYDYHPILRGKVTRMTDPTGAVTQYGYDFYSGELTERVDPHQPGEDSASYATRYTYDAWLTLDGRQWRRALQRITLPSGGQLLFEHDSLGNTTSVRDGEGNMIEATTFDSVGRILTETDRFGSVVHRYGAGPEPVETTHADGSVASMTYDPSGNLAVLDDAGAVSRARHDALGRETQLDFGPDLVLDMQYDEGSMWSRMESAHGVTERLSYASGRIAGWRLDGSTAVSFGYDASGQLRRTTQPDGSVDESTYDAAGRLQSVRRGATGATTSYQRDAVGRPTLVTDALGYSTSIGYHPSGRVASVTDARGNTWAYASAPSSSSVVDPLGRETVTTTNDYGLVTSVRFSDGHQRHASYLGATRLESADERPLSETDEAGRVRSYSYDSHGRLESATDLAGSVWLHSQLSGGIDVTTTPEGRSWRIERDEGGAVTRAVYPDGSETSVLYDSLGRAATQTLPDGSTISFAYDASHRIVSRTAPAGETSAWTYTPLGAVETVTNPAGMTQYSYDVAGRLQSITGPDGQVLEYAWDALDRVTSVSVRVSAAAAARTTHYSYDEVGNVTRVTSPSGGITTMSYDEVDRLVERILPNGVVSTWTYDLRDRVETVVHRSSGGGVLVSASYSRGPTGEPTRVTRHDGSYVDYDYDAAWRLVEERHHDPSGALSETISYTYDLDGTRTSRTTAAGLESYASGAGYRLASVTGASSQTFAYDAAGRVTSLGRNGDVTTLAYDSESYLASAGSSSGTTTYARDGAGRRVRTVDATGEHRYLVGPSLGAGFESPHLVTGGSGATLAEYVYAGEHALSRVDAGGDETFYLRDAMGSVVGVVDSAGALTGTSAYDAFGNVRGATGVLATVPSDTAGDFRFHGMWLDPTGLYHARARAYDPVTGRFLTRDPVEADPEVPEAWHPYAYGASNPNVYRDPLGLFSLQEIQVGEVISGILRRSATMARQAAIGEAKDAAFEAVGTVVQQALAQAVPGASMLSGAGLFLAANPFQAGRIFEDLVEENICGMLPSLDNGTNYLWVSVPIGGGGGPSGNGFNCGASGAPPPRAGRHRGYSSRRNSFPDMLFSAHPPSRLMPTEGRRSYLVVEIKLSGRAIRNSRQFRRIVAHGARYSWPPLATWLTLRPPSAAKRRSLQRQAVSIGRRYGRPVGAVVVSLM